jgi:hypothetical protein
MMAAIIPAEAPLIETRLLLVFQIAAAFRLRLNKTPVG